MGPGNLYKLLTLTFAAASGSGDVRIRRRDCPAGRLQRQPAVRRPGRRESGDRRTGRRSGFGRSGTRNLAPVGNRRRGACPPPTLPPALTRWSGRRRSARSCFPVQVRFEQLQDPLVLVRPARRLNECVILRRKERQFPVLLPQLDLSLIHI